MIYSRCSTGGHAGNVGVVTLAVSTVIFDLWRSRAQCLTAKWRIENSNKWEMLILTPKCRLLWNYTTIENCFSLFLPARRYASAGYSDPNVSVRLSVRLSVTRRYCVKMKKASGMISSPSGSTKTLVFWRQISSPNYKGFPPNGSLKQGSVGKIQRFSSFNRQYLENGSRYGQIYY